MSIKFYPYLTLVALCLCVAGCDRNEEAQTAYTLEKVVIVGSQWYGHAPVWVGIEKGIFERHGFNVVWRFTNKSQDRVKAVAEGEAYFTSVGALAMIEAMTKDNRGFYWVGHQDNAPGFEGIVAQHGINTIEDLANKTIGFPFGSSVDITCRLLLRKHGLDPKNADVKLINLKPSDVLAAFRAGEVDAALIWEPDFSLLQKVDGSKVLATDKDTEAYELFHTMTGPDVLVINKTWVDSDKQRAKRFMRAYFESVDWVSSHPDDTAAIIHHRYVQQELSILRDNLQEIKWHSLKDQRQLMSDMGVFQPIEFMIDFMYSKEQQIISNKPNYREWVNLDILSTESPP